MRTESTPGARGPVFCGVDTHADSHWLCVLDWSVFRQEDLSKKSIGN